VGTSWSLPWYGSSVTVGFNQRKQDSTNLFTTFTPQYNATLSFGVVQPLPARLQDRPDPPATRGADAQPRHLGIQLQSRW